MESFLKALRQQGDGYHIVGLDNHTGFLKVEADGSVAFIHSGPGHGVVREASADAPELVASRYRVTGKVGNRSSLKQPPDPSSKPLQIPWWRFESAMETSQWRPVSLVDQISTGS